MVWFRKAQYTSLKPAEPTSSRVPEGLWHKCGSCLGIVYKKDFEENLFVCPKCNFHERIGSRVRLEILADPNTFQETNDNLLPTDPLGFTDQKKYSERLLASQKKTGLKDAIITGTCLMDGRKIALGVMEFAFSGGSMGSVVGEKVTRVVEQGLEERLPVLLVCCSGGARMQEGTYSLMQLAKTCSVIGRFQRAGLPLISLLTNPTTAGVMASFGSLGDIIIAEPDALICFAGPRVIEQTINQILPKGFQRSEFVAKHGFLDMVVNRKDLRPTISRLFSMLTHGAPKSRSKKPREGRRKTSQEIPNPEEIQAAAK
ncbi:MAG: acetyl-CoA carboxylase, carboxyltransferase subunit beta [bacterium]